MREPKVPGSAGEASPGAEEERDAPERAARQGRGKAKNSGARGRWAATLVLLGSAALFYKLQPDEADQVAIPAEKAGQTFAIEEPAPAPPKKPMEEADEPGDESRALVLPNGKAPSLSCSDARRIVAQARTMIAAPAATVDPSRFAVATSDWLDPYGLWSVAPDSPMGALLEKDAVQLLAELEAPGKEDACPTFDKLGGSLATWTKDIRSTMQTAEKLAKKARPLPSTSKARWEIAESTPFEDGQIERKSKDLARLIGHGAGTLEALYGDEIEPYATATIDRAAPSMGDADWAKVILAASVRAYIPQLDPHGAWAPMDEETSIYDLSLEVDPPDHLWGDMTRTTLGVRIDRGAKAPLKNGDVILDVMGVKLGGLSAEQDNQLAVVAPGADEEITILRDGSAHPIALELIEPKPERGGKTETDETLVAKQVPFGDGTVAIIAIPDVPDDLGDKLSVAVREAKQAPKLKGIMLDLRGNGGGSTDGAMAALGIFLPGASMFPMKRRDGGIEVDRAPVPPASDAWDGPLAVLVDGDTASAAEMISGAIQSYHRGILVGARTYGKGCAQEYLDDDAQRGILRLTTLVFSLPDGSPLQRVGVKPTIALGVSQRPEREAFLPHALETWRGPDVREPALIREFPWPTNGGHVGPCDDEMVCRGLRALGANKAVSAKTTNHH